MAKIGRRQGGYYREDGIVQIKVFEISYDLV